MKKHQRQPSQDVSTSRPPISGPAMVATPKTSPNNPEYRPSSRGGIIAAMTIMASEPMPPGPMPRTLPSGGVSASNTIPDRVDLCPVRRSPENPGCRTPP